MAKALTQVRLERDVEPVVRKYADVMDRSLQAEVNRRLRVTLNMQPDELPNIREQGKLVLTPPDSRKIGRFAQK